MDITFITGNQAKADYLAKWLGHPVEHQKVDLEEIQSLDPYEVIEHKARAAYEMVGKTVLVEDVSLSFNALGGKLPGTLIKWFLSEVGNEGLLKMLEGFDDRTATAGIVYGLYDGNKMHTFDAFVKGRVSTDIRGGDLSWSNGKGLSWNYAFIPDGSDKTYAEMDEVELEQFGHRAKAIEKLRTFLDEQPKD